jgi:hypothetical protein
LIIVPQPALVHLLDLADVASKRSDVSVQCA